MTDAITYVIDQGHVDASVDMPAPAGSVDAKRWIARVKRDRGARAGLSRIDFFEKGQPHWYRVPRDLKPGDVIEIAVKSAVSRSQAMKGNFELRARYRQIVEVDADRIVAREVSRDDVVQGRITPVEAQVFPAWPDLSSVSTDALIAELRKRGAVLE